MLDKFSNKCINVANHVLVICNIVSMNYKSVFHLKVDGHEFEFVGLWKTRVPHICLLAFSVPSYTENTLVDKNAEIIAIYNDITILEFSVRIETLLSYNKYSIDQSVEFVLGATINLPEFIRFAIELVAASEDVEYFKIENAFIVNRKLVTSGWMRDASEYKLHIFSNDLRFHVTPENFFFHSRADVSAELQKLHDETKGNRHGFVCVCSLDAENEYSNFIFARVENNIIERVGEFHCTKSPSHEEIVSSLWQLQSAGSVVDVAFVDHAIRPLVAQQKINHKYRVKSFYSSNTKITLSVIIPFFKESFFISSIFLLQEQFPEFVEWIYICDDSKTAIEVTRYIDNRSDAIVRNTKVVINNDNYGYSVSNNIGVRCASGSTLLFMNSDIWIDNTIAVIDALNQIRAEAFHLIGFRLLFEDGSLQHDGMIFKRSRAHSDLYLAEHFSKGLPPQQVDVPLRETIAVTGALMMVDRKTYEDIGGFDQNYVKGDFEDADLCLSCRAKGKRVGIMHANGNYHLERQSIKKIGKKSYRAALTLVNCLYFNKKWRNELIKLG